MTRDYKWWKDATVYQIWPASYKDSNGDGIGDIPGIISTLDYIQKLGTDVIWLSPMYDSPQQDMGYDISDYRSVYPKYGTLDDMDTLIKETHKRGMKLILDLVINHTSVEHEWFKESRSSKTNPKRDWYIWKPARYDEQGNRHPPNNWMSIFSGSAWKYDPTTEEYYLHLFADGQPDLNWENEETRNAIYDHALTFWFEKGVDGFRIDTAGMYSKNQKFPDAPIVFPDSKWQPCGMYYQNGPRIHEFHKEMFAKVTSKYDAMTVGEVGHSSAEEALRYVSAKENEMNMIFLFDLVDLGSAPNDRYDYIGYGLKDLKKAIRSQSSFAEGTDAWATVFGENHDQPRSISRFADDSKKYRNKSGKLLALLQTSLSGTLYIYQGQEIGMTNFPRSWSIDEYKDVSSINYYNAFKKAHGNDPELMEKLMDNLSIIARDHARTPVQWDNTANAGFTSGTPWMRVNDNYKEINVESQVDVSDSLFSFWKDSLNIRKRYKDLFIYGSFKMLDYENEDVFSFMKENGDQSAYVVLNFSSKSVPFENLTGSNLKLINSNVDSITENTLTPFEGRIYLVE